MSSPLLAVALTLSALATCTARADDEVAVLLRDVKAVGKQGAGSPAARAAWDKLVAAGPAVLPPLLDAMDTPDTVAANWLRTAFDRIVETEMKAGGKKIDADALLAFAKEPKHQGRARRVALEAVERLRPGTAEQLAAGWLHDPEFRADAVDVALKKIDALPTPGAKRAAYQELFRETRDIGQVKAVAARLKDLGGTVSIADHLGFLKDWYLIGPFDAKNMQGFQTVYPPEEKVDLKAEYDGKKGKVAWKRHTAAEPPPAGFNDKGLIVSLPEALGNADDAVGYAYTEIRVPADVDAEFRGAGDDNFSVWVNGKRAFGFEEYRNDVRLDRHRFRVKLKAGVNTVLVKVCQAPRDPTSPEPNWEFLLRVVDDTGKGIDFQDALPAEKK
jgi:hypothetical protein